MLTRFGPQLDDPGDLARICRTCRVLNYMSLPQLYKDLTLTSYGRIRYRGEEPEGMGSASPFSNGLNAVITRPYAGLVRSLTLRGEWREHELEEHARVGRVPDSSMMLNIAVRAAVDRMTDLQSFNWELNTKLLETVYLGLSQLPRLTTLSVRFPSSRHPRPTIVIPPMPHLRRLKLTDIDPLCYPDDISTLLWKCKKLRELYMHWSPRMRNAQEPSVMLHDYFRKCVAAREPLVIKKLALQNLYAFHSEEFNLAFDPKTVEDITLLNDAGSDGPSFMNTFVDRSWPAAPPHERLRIKCIRQDALSKRNAEFLRNFTGLEKLYFVNNARDANEIVNFPRNSPAAQACLDSNGHSASPAAISPNSPATAAATAAASPSTNTSFSRILQETHLNAIVTNHASTLRHLLLPSRWPLSANTVYRLVHASPQLEQLACATDIPSTEALGILFPFLRKLVALRLLIPTGNISSPPYPVQTTIKTNGTAIAPRSLAEVAEQDDEILLNKISVSLSDRSVHGNLKILGLGRKAWELLDFYPISEEQASTTRLPETCGKMGDYKFASESNAQNQNQNENGINTNTDLGTPLSSPHTSPTSKKHNHHRHLSASASILGKRPRDTNDDAWPQRPSPSPSARDPPNTQHTPTGNNGVPSAENDMDCGLWHISPDVHLWRRRVRPVGWEVLKHWEIWELDKQEL